MISPEIINNKEYEYFAFISYKREDESWAKWLQNKLEAYKFPTRLHKKNPQLPSRIRPVFRDQSELSGGILKTEIERGLHNSKYLIVICSPRSARSPWVSKEVQYFINEGRQEYIIPFIIGGTPNAQNPEEECFPEGLRELTNEKELLGININEMGREAAVIKTIARMLSLKFDSLWQRHEKIRKKKLLLLALAATLIVILSLFFAGFIQNKNLQLRDSYSEIKRQKEMADFQRNRAENMNKELIIANDSIDLQSKLLKTSNDSLYKTNKLLKITLNKLHESNINLKQEKLNVIKSNQKYQINYARTVALKAIEEINKGNVEESLMALLSVAPEKIKNDNLPYVPEVESALRLAYDKLNSNEWIYTELDGFYDIIYLTANEKYVIAENTNSIDIYNPENDNLVVRLNLSADGTISSKDGSKLYISGR